MADAPSGWQGVATSHLPPNLPGITALAAPAGAGSATRPAGIDTYYLAECGLITAVLKFGPRPDGKPHPPTVVLPCLLDGDCPSGGDHELRQVDAAEYQRAMAAEVPEARADEVTVARAWQVLREEAGLADDPDAIFTAPEELLELAARRAPTADAQDRVRRAAAVLWPQQQVGRG